MFLKYIAPGQRPGTPRPDPAPPGPGPAPPGPGPAPPGPGLPGPGFPPYSPRTLAKIASIMADTSSEDSSLPSFDEEAVKESKL